jgi:transcriptional regulator with XRE-family HTH domain
VDSAGEVIKEARRRAGLSQRELAEITGVSQPNIAAYEAGMRVPSLSMLQRLAGACRHHVTFGLERGRLATDGEVVKLLSREPMDRVHETLPWTLGRMARVAAPIVLTGHIAARLLGAPVDASRHEYALVRLSEVPVLVARARQARHQVRMRSECSGWDSLQPGHELEIGSMIAVVVSEAPRPTWVVDLARGALPVIGLAGLLALDCWNDSDRSALARLDEAIADRGEAAHGLRPFSTSDIAC